MKITEARTKVKACQKLLSEYTDCHALARAMEKDLTLYDEKYYYSVKNRMDKILEKLDTILK